MRLRSFADDFFPDPPRAEYFQPRRRAVRCWSSSAAQRTGNPGGMASVRNSPVIPAALRTVRLGGRGAWHLTSVSGQNAAGACLAIRSRGADGQRGRGRVGEAPRDQVEPARGGSRGSGAPPDVRVRAGAAEQMFHAAAGTGAVTRPLLVFYGLSQVGRAIAAAAASAGSGGWELEGHGIRCVPGTLRGPLPDNRCAGRQGRQQGQLRAPVGTARLAAGGRRRNRSR